MERREEVIVPQEVEPQPISEFEGVSDPNFLEFLQESNKLMVRNGEQVLFRRTLLNNRRLLYPEVDPEKWPDIKILEPKLFPLKDFGLYPHERVSVKGVNSKPRVTDTDGMLNVLSFLYVRCIEKDIGRTGITLLRVAELWGDNPRADLFTTAVDKLKSTREERKSNVRIEGEIRRGELDAKTQRQLLIEEKLKVVPPHDQDNFKEIYDVSLRQLIRDVEKVHPLWAIETGDKAINEFPARESVIHAVRFIHHIDSGDVRNFELSPMSISPREVMLALKHLQEVISQYKELFSRHLKNSNRVTLDNVYNIKVDVFAMLVNSQ